MCTGRKPSRRRSRRRPRRGGGCSTRNGLDGRPVRKRGCFSSRGLASGASAGGLSSIGFGGTSLRSLSPVGAVGLGSLSPTGLVGLGSLSRIGLRGALASLSPVGLGAGDGFRISSGVLRFFRVGLFSAFAGFPFLTMTPPRARQAHLSRGRSPNVSPRSGCGFSYYSRRACGVFFSSFFG